MIQSENGVYKYFSDFSSASPAPDKCI